MKVSSGFSVVAHLFKKGGRAWLGMIVVDDQGPYARRVRWLVWESESNEIDETHFKIKE